MSYLGDIRENSIGPNGELWEADNRIEERHYWNGAYIDLCNLPGEEYAKTIFMTNGSGPGTGGDDPTPTIPVKSITLEIIEGDVVMMFAGTLSSDLYVSISYNGDEKYTMKIEKGTSGASGIAFGLGDVKTVEKYGIGATEEDALNSNKTYQDEEYKYQISFTEPVVIPVAYQVSMIQGHVDDMNDAILIELIRSSEKLEMADHTKTQSFVAKIEPVAVDGLAEMNAVELTQALIDNAQDIVIATNSDIVDILAASTLDSVIEGWTKRKSDVIVDGIVYHVWYKRANDTELSAVYDPAVPEAVIEIPKDSITFIIKYA